MEVKPEDRIGIKTINDVCSTPFLISLPKLYHLNDLFSKLYCPYYDLISKFNIGLKSLLCQGLSEPKTRIPRIGCVAWQNRNQTRHICQIHIPEKNYIRETYKSQNITPISRTPKFTLSIIQIKAKSLSTGCQC